MPYKYHWFDAEHTIIQMDIFGQVTWDEWHTAIDKIINEIKNTSHRVDIIFHDSVGMPKGNPIPHLNLTNKKFGEQPNIGIIVTVSPRRVSSFVEMIIKIILRGSKRQKSSNGSFVTTMDEALNRIKQSRSKEQAAN